MKYELLRIRNRDENNWVIEGYVSGGQVISRGRYAGQVSKGGWDENNPLGYYQTLEHAARRLLDYEIKMLTDVVGDNIINKIEEARKSVIAAVKEAQQ